MLIYKRFKTSKLPSADGKRSPPKTSVKKKQEIKVAKRIISGCLYYTKSISSKSALS